MNVTARLASVNMSPRKMNEVAALVRGHMVTDALTILEHTPRRAALPLKKLLQSAQANAENNHNARPQSLRVITLDVGPGQRLRRYRPAAHGRARPYRRQASSVRVVIEGAERAKKKPAKAKATAKATEEKK